MNMESAGSVIMWAMSGNVWAMDEELPMVIHTLLSYNCGIL